MKIFPPTPEQAKGIGISVAMEPGELIQFNAYAGSGSRGQDGGKPGDCRRL